MEQKLKHLDFLQGTINRLSTNSFLLKGWSVVLVSALFVLSGDNSDRNFAILAVLPSMIIWGLDGYFLWQERLFRRLYDRVRLIEAEDVDFSMSTKEVSTGFGGLVGAVLSKTLISFHGAIISAIALVAYLSEVKNGTECIL